MANRREFLKTTGLLVVGFSLREEVFAAQGARGEIAGPRAHHACRVARSPCRIPGSNTRKPYLEYAPVRKRPAARANGERRSGGRPHGACGSRVTIGLPSLVLAATPPNDPQ